MSRSLRARLERLERQHEEVGCRPDWDALATPGGFPDFLASLGPPPAPDPEAVARRARLAALCAEFDCTPLDLGLPDTPEDLGITRHGPPDGPATSGFVAVAPGPEPAVQPSEVPPESPQTQPPPNHESTQGEPRHEEHDEHAGR